MTYRLGVVPKKMRRRTNRARSADGKSLIVRRAAPDEVVDQQLRREVGRLERSYSRRKWLARA